MAMKRCSNGHFYDGAKYSQCPYCGISDKDSQRTSYIGKEYNLAPGPAQPANAGAVGKTVAMGRTSASAPDQNQTMSNTRSSDDIKTVSITKKQKGIDPVVGWLVCVSGASKGKDYRIKTERNFIGRDAAMDIAITDDTSISRENHAIISYDPKNSSFMVMPGDSHGLVYLNDTAVYIPTEIKSGDVIELGQTKLMFVPFCSRGGFTW